MLERDKIAAGWYCDGCGSREHIIDIRARDKNFIACCPERKLVPPNNPTKKAL